MINAGIQIGAKIKELRLRAAGPSRYSGSIRHAPENISDLEKDFTSSVQNLINICDYFGVSVGIILKSIQDALPGLMREVR